MQSSVHIAVFAALWLVFADQKAGAVVVFVDIVPDFLVNYANPIYDLDMNGDGIRDLRIASQVASNHGFEVYTDPHVRVQDIQVGDPGSYWVWAFNEGQEIANIPLGPASWHHVINGSTLAGNIETSYYGFFVLTTAYMGVELTEARCDHAVPGAHGLHGGGVDPR